MAKERRRLINFIRTAAPSRASALRILVFVLFGVGALMVYTSALLNQINMSIAGLSDVHSMIEMQALVMKLAFLYFVTFIVFLGGALIYLFVLRQRVNGPTIAIRHYIRELKNGNFAYRRELRPGDELGVILEDLKDLAAHLKNNQKGFSAVGLLITVAIIAAVVGNFAFMYKNMMSGNQAIKYSTNALTFNDEVRGVLASEAACRKTFAGLSMDESQVHPLAKILNEDGAVRYQPGPLYGDGTLKIEKMSVRVGAIQPAAVTGEAALLIDVAPSSSGTGKTGKSQEVIFSFRRDPVTKVIVNCIAKSKVSDGIWRRSAKVDDIYFGGGHVSIGSPSARAALDVDGTILGKRATAVGGSTVDFDNGNLQFTAGTCGAFNLHNLHDGGTYLFVVQGAAASTCAFQAWADAGKSALTVHLPPDHGQTQQSKHTLYSFAVVGAHVYVSWIPGY